MQAIKRYCLVAVVALGIIVLATYFGRSALPGNPNKHGYHLQPRSFHSEKDHELDQDVHVSAKQRRQTPRPPVLSVSAQDKECRMETCFDFSRCQNSFKVYVYPTTNHISSKYEEILKAIRQSNYYTDDPSEACILVPSVDTLDRDKLSKDNYVIDIESQIAVLSHWNNGQNHLVFNLYAGTWPDYAEDDYGFSAGKAMLAQASITDIQYRPGFDISFPLFHKEHAFKGGEPGFLTANSVPPVREYTLAFKGKRYLTGIGSETRNSLYHIHNDKDIILLTTCKHGKGWENMVDERCERDNEEYDKYDYKTLLHKSTFCLVPRGRRLGSYRFLEALQASCVPVLLSNGWVLPFSEVIDWNRAVVWGDERLLLQVPSIVRSISHADILSLRQQNQFLWDTYFSSIDKIIDTTLEILKDRINRHLARTAFVWNTPPGALYTLTEYSQNLATYPFFLRPLALTTTSHFTAVVYVRSSVVTVMSPLYRLVKNVGRSRYLQKILILWHCDSPPSTDIRWPVPSDVPVIYKIISALSHRYTPFEDITTDAVLSLDEDASLLTDEVDFAFHVWQHFPERLIGYVARSHYWHDNEARWRYSSAWTNDYSMVLTASAFYHKYYTYLFMHWLSPETRSLVDQWDNCEDILMNFLITHVTKYPPIKLTQHKYLHELPQGGVAGSSVLGGEKLTSNATVFPPAPQPVAWFSAQHFSRRQQCMNMFTQEFGYMPLVRSSSRFDPLLFKDPVSRTRKKYRQIDITS